MSVWRNRDWEKLNSEVVCKCHVIKTQTVKIQGLINVTASATVKVDLLKQKDIRILCLDLTDNIVHVCP